MTAYQHIASNKRRSIFLVLIFVALVLGLGYVLDYTYGSGTGIGGLGMAVIISLFMTMLSYFAGDKVALFTSGAQEIRKEDNPYVWRLVENLSITIGQPMPRVHIISDPALNAFATGRDPKHASIALTTGIVDALENEELEAVIAHELSHIQNYDTRLLMIVAVLVGAIALLADWMWRFHFTGSGRKNSRGGGQIELIFMVVGLVLILLSPIIAELIKLAISRKREALADASAVLMTRYADGLIGALQKIAQHPAQLQRANHATAHLFFVNPFRAGTLRRLWSTHPPIEERITALRQMGGQTV